MASPVCRHAGGDPCHRGPLRPSAVAGLFRPHTERPRRDVAAVEWVLMKLNDEVTRYVIEEKIVKRDQRGATPDPGAARGQGQPHRAPALFQLAVRHAAVDRGRYDDARRFRAGGASERARLSGRCRLGHFGRNARLVFAHQVAARLPHLAQRPGRRPAPQPAMPISTSN